MSREIPVTAAASLPCSFTSILAWWKISDTQLCSLLIPVRLALDSSKMSCTPRLLSTDTSLILLVTVNLGRVSRAFSGLQSLWSWLKSVPAKRAIVSLRLADLAGSSSSMVMLLPEYFRDTTSEFRSALSLIRT